MRPHLVSADAILTSSVQLPFRLLVMILLITMSGCALFNAVEEEVIRIDTLNSRHLAEKSNKMGLHWLENGDLHLAEHSFEKAIIVDETYGPPHNNLGQMHFDAGDMYQAAVSFDTAARLMPNNPIPHNNLGLALETGGKLEEAIEHYQLAYELDRTNEEFLGNLVRVRMRLDPWDESVVGQLRELKFIETRLDWLEWIEEQLEIRHNPYLDRGPGGPDFTALNEDDNEKRSSDKGYDAVIEELAPLQDNESDDTPGEWPASPDLPPLPSGDDFIVPPDAARPIDADDEITTFMPSLPVPVRVSTPSGGWMPTGSSPSLP